MQANSCADSGKTVATNDAPTVATAVTRLKSLPMTTEDRTDGVLHSSLQKFQELRKRRADLTKISEFKLLMNEKKDGIRGKKSHKRQKDREEVTPGTSTISCSMNEDKWKKVREYFDINAHLEGPVSHGIREPKSGLEEKINAAIAEGKFEKAENLSDQLANREFAVRVNGAFAAKRYAESEQLKKETILRKHQKRIPWGFESKQRWEMKGNM